MPENLLPAGIALLERGWLSSNNVVCTGRHGSAVIDTGYAVHADQTVGLVRHALADRPLDVIVNTHLHSDHCGGNAALQAAFPGSRTLIPPGEADAARAWREGLLSHSGTGQLLPRFRVDGVLPVGESIALGEHEWQVYPAAGHDPHSVILFAPRHRVLVSADALWENGFGLVFPELVGHAAFDAVQATLSLIESLQPSVVIPGHGPAFADAASALARARSRLAAYRKDPKRHARHAARVMIRFKLLEVGRWGRAEFEQWFDAARLLQDLHAEHFASEPWPGWRDALLEDLQGAGAIALSGDLIINRP